MNVEGKRRAIVAYAAIVGFLGFSLATVLTLYALLGKEKKVEVASPAEATPTVAPPSKPKGDCQPQKPKAEAGAAPQWLPDVTEEWGVDFQHVVGPLGTYFMPESIGAGGALLDIDNDDDLDLFLVNSDRSPKATGEFPAGWRMGHRLYLQIAPGEMVDATAVAGLEEVTYGVGCAVGDIDDDGFADLYITNYADDRLYHNNGDGTFSDISKEWGIKASQWGTCAAFLDYDRDRNLDLFVVHYTHDPQHGHSIACGLSKDRVSYCGPLKFEPTTDGLFHNEGRSGPDAMQPLLRDVTTESGIAAEPTFGFGVVCGDFNGDGWPDLYVANDAAPKRLWINQRDGTFRDRGVTSGAGFNMRGRPEGSMGVTMGDYDGDADFDLIVSNLSTEGASVYRAESALTFAEVGGDVGLRTPTMPHTGWGIALLDLDHDGDLDLPMVNGLVIPCNSGFAPHGEETFYVRNERIDDPEAFWRLYADPNLLFLNERGKFVERSSEAADFCAAVGSGRGLIYGDIDNDGDLDMVVTNCGGKARVYRNDMPKSGRWLQVRAIDPSGQRAAYGAKIIVQAGGKEFARFVNPAGSYLASNDPRAHFGLGEAETYDSITVRWPDGARERFPGGAADRRLSIVRGQGEPISLAR